jgi:hypothetical protein
VKADLRGPHRAAELGGDLLERELGKVAERNDASRILRKLLRGLVQALAAGAPVVGLLDVAGLRRIEGVEQFQHRHCMLRNHPPAPTQVIVPDVARDPPGPAAKRSVATESLQPANDPQQGLLGQVLRQDGVAATPGQVGLHVGPQLLRGLGIEGPGRSV